MIHHSDQGCQYTSLEFGRRCQAAGVRPSMGSVGGCYDNAMCESFFATLECELLERVTPHTPAEGQLTVFDGGGGMRPLWKLPEPWTPETAPTAPWKTTGQVFHSSHRSSSWFLSDQETESVNRITMSVVVWPPATPGAAHVKGRAVCANSF